MDMKNELEVRREILNKIISKCSGNLLNDEVIKSSRLLDELICLEQNKLKQISKCMISFL